MPDSTPSSGDDEFDRIVEGLDLEMPRTEHVEREVAREQPKPEPRPRKPQPAWDEDAIAYRTPPPRKKRPPSKARTASWIAVLGAPGLLVLATIVRIVLPRPIVLAAALTFVAGLVYLISQLPERGPSHPDSPDDGAVL